VGCFCRADCEAAQFGTVSVMVASKEAECSRQAL